MSNTSKRGEGAAEELGGKIKEAVGKVIGITEFPTGPYPYAGVPWFNTPFKLGRAIRIGDDRSLGDSWQNSARNEKRRDGSTQRDAVR